MSSKRALVTGVSGQDGSYLAELLLDRDYEVIGVVRRDPAQRFENLEAVQDRVQLVQADLVDERAVAALVRQHRPHEIYNLASVSTSWGQPATAVEFVTLQVTLLLEAIRLESPSTRVYQASSSEVFGRPPESPQSELTPLAPLTYYGAAKAYSQFMTRIYRVRHDVHASSGILYNHESPRRPLSFVTRKITHAAAAIKLGRQQQLVLGDVDARRDWGYAPDYVEAMWSMLQQRQPDDYVVATGVTHSVGELAAIAFDHVGLDWRRYVESDASLRRGSQDLAHLVGDASKARERLGWRPRVGFEQMVRAMVDADLARLGATSVAGGGDSGLQGRL